MNARMQRLQADYLQIKKDFTNHPNIIVEPIGTDPTEKYRITYYLNGIYLLEEGTIERLGKHVVEIVLPAEYPRYRPICTIKTPIWHPNFKDGQICIGDIWGAGESLSDIIVNIGDMIQYRSWNSYSPLSADAARWAIEHKHLFPLGTVDLWPTDRHTERVDFDIELGGNFVEDKSFDSAPAGDTDTRQHLEETVRHELEKPEADTIGVAEVQKEGNDFDITPEELAGIKFIPSSQRIQTMRNSIPVKGSTVNFMTILKKGLLYGLIGGLLGWIFGEIIDLELETIIAWMGHDPNTIASYEELLEVIKSGLKISAAILFALLGAFIGSSMGLGEGMYYGSRNSAIRFAAIGLAIGIGLGALSGYIAQGIYWSMLSDVSTNFAKALVRAVGWAVLGLGIGLSVGLIRPDKKRVLFCCLGGLAGGFIGGLVFNSIAGAIQVSESDTGIVARAIGFIIMGGLIGLGVGLLEQFAKAAWLKVIRGDFEGKEYLVFQGTTPIGNSGKNAIVLFKDKLVAPFHCRITLDGRKYILFDNNSPNGTLVNGISINRYVLKHGDIISLGNSVLVFNTK